MSDKAIGEVLGIKTRKVRSIRENLGLYKNKKYTTDDYIEMCEKNNFIFDHNEIYKGTNTIFFYCKNHIEKGIQYKPIAAMKYGCKYCGNKVKLDKSDIESRLKENNANIIIVGDYKGMCVSTDFYCKKHDYYYTTSPGNALKYLGCKYCGYEKQSVNSTMSIEQAQELVNIKNPHIKILEHNGSINTGLVKCFCKKTRN